MGSCSGDNDDQDGNGNDYDDNEDDDGSYKQLYLEKNSLLVGLGVSGGAEAGRTKTGGSRHFLPTSETLLCFKVKVNMMTKPTNKQNICKQTVSGLACRPLPLCLSPPLPSHHRRLQVLTHHPIIKTPHCSSNQYF